MDSVSHRYAQALFQLADELHSVSAWQKYMADVRRVVVDEPQLIQLLKHSEYPLQEKHRLITKIFNDSPQEILNFMRLLADRKRIQYLESIALEFHHLCNESQGIKEGVIYSAISLPVRSIREIEGKLSAVLNQKIELSVSLDTQLIGGYKVVIGDRVYDNTLTHQLHELRQSMTEGKR